MAFYDEVLEHFQAMRRVVPTVEDALLFIGTELAEASELILRTKPYRRNHNREGYTPERFAEELGDIMYMCIVAGFIMDVDPESAARTKMQAQMEKAKAE